MKKALCAMTAALLATTAFVGCGSKDDSSSSTNDQANNNSVSNDSKQDASESKTDSKNDKTVVFIPKLTGNAFFEAANVGAQEHSKKVGGYTVKFDGSAEASVANQVTIINNAIQQGADAICVSSVDATGLDSALKEAQEAGIKVVTWDADVSTDARSIMVSQGTPEQLGQMLVDMAVESLQERGKDPSADEIKYAWHYSQATVADQNSWQVAGEEYIAEKYPNWVNVAPSNYYSEQDSAKAISVVDSILSSNKDIDLVICTDSDRKITRLNSSHLLKSRMPSSA